MAAPDVRTISRPLGRRDGHGDVLPRSNAGVLVMNNVPPPSQGTVYQMWLLGANGPTSAGTMDTAAVAPSTTATLPNLGARRRWHSPSNPATGHRSRPARYWPSCP